ncbi:hypothetical protein, partial [Synechococcus sp. MU1655]|uniref:hypothetical protein n=1 Tax=Synechococcus sp. MU1655 TaxID=2508355 RepID=UPI0020275AB9
MKIDGFAGHECKESLSPHHLSCGDGGEYWQYVLLSVSFAGDIEWLRFARWASVLGACVLASRAFDVIDLSVASGGYLGSPAVASMACIWLFCISICGGFEFELSLCFGSILLPWLVFSDVLYASSLSVWADSS